MKEINILSIVKAYRNLEKGLFRKFIASLGVSSGIKEYELDGLEMLIRELLKINQDDSILTHYFLGYSIPQIGKEFDLLRFGTDTIVNIEIKTDSSCEKVLRQQKRNRYYLSFLGKELLIYTYLSKSNKLYRFTSGFDGDKILEVPMNELYNKLSCQKIAGIENPDDLFNPSDYLVSPFNSTDKFIDDKYFLTEQQEKIFHEILSRLNDPKDQFMALTGSAGTGKTLLTYHIAKYAMSKGLKVLILHCGPLNEGHNILKEQYDWNIQMPRYASDVTDFDIVIIDEAQRLYLNQFEKITKMIKSGGIKCIFSFDAKQYLRVAEHQNAITQRIEEDLSCSPYRLTEKIRTNKEIAYFIKQLFNSKQNIPGISYPNVKFSYFKDYRSAKSLLDVLAENGWKTPNYTPGTRTTFHYEKYSSYEHASAHSVVGQEFDKVAVIVDSCFAYDLNGKLYADNSYYSQRQMLYQILTRTRKQLYLIILDNKIMLNRVIEIMDNSLTIKRDKTTL